MKTVITSPSRLKSAIRTEAAVRVLVRVAFLVSTTATPLTAQRAVVDSAVNALSNAPNPAGYVLGQFKNHRLVMLAEPHWIAHDVALLRDIIPKLRAAGVNTLAAEWVRANQQQAVNELMNSATWNQPLAIQIMRGSSWPYADYLQVLRQVWETNRNLVTGQQPLYFLAFGPAADWRETLIPAGMDAEKFMAALLSKRLDAGSSNHILAAVGFHHSFTRFLQPDLPEGNRAMRFNDRMGNILWRTYGQNIFSIVLHHPWYCRKGGKWDRCLPLDGAIDCTGARLRRPFGFDVAASPFAGSRIDNDVWYGVGQPFLRLDNLVDGYIWTKPIEDYKSVSLIPLDQYAPDAEALKSVMAENPVTDAAIKSRSDAQREWKKRGVELGDPLASRGWDRLKDWRRVCG